MSLELLPEQNRQCACCGCRSDIMVMQGFQTGRLSGLIVLCESCFRDFASKVAAWIAFIDDRPRKGDSQ